MKPSISRLVKARTSAKMAASALDSGTGGHATEDTIGNMLAHSRKEPVIDLVYSSRENTSSDEDEDSICLIKPSPKLTSVWWQYYRVYDPVLHPEMKHIVVCNVRGCNHPINEDSKEQDNGNEGTNYNIFVLYMVPAQTSQKLLSIMQRGKCRSR